MYAGLKFLPLVMLGVGAICWALPASHTLTKPLDIIAALTALAGMALFLLGILLFFVPGFFSS